MGCFDNYINSYFIYDETEEMFKHVQIKGEKWGKG